MRITHLPKDPGSAAWNAILPAADPYHACEGSITAEEFENQIQLDNLTGAFGEDGELDPFDKVAKRETH